MSESFLVLKTFFIGNTLYMIGTPFSIPAAWQDYSMIRRLIQNGALMSDEAKEPRAGVLG